MSVTTSASSSSQLSKFHEGLKVLVVETDMLYLQELVELLRNFCYEVTKCSGADEALILLKDEKEKFDVVVADFDTLDMNEFDFLDSAIAASCLPIVGFSVNRDVKYIEKGLVRGASVLFEKPVTKECMGMLWQLVVRHKHLSTNSNSSSDITTTNHATSKPKPRFVWTKQGEALFVEAVNYLGGPDNAVPKRIHEYMIERGMKGLNSRHISSHLQKYRGDMKLLQKQQQEQSITSIPFHMLNNMSRSTLVPNSSYLPYKPSNPSYPSSSSSVQLPGFNNMGTAYSSQTEPSSAFLYQPNNGSYPYPYPATSTMLSQFNPNPNPNPNLVFENQINCCPSNNDDHGMLSGNESADYQMVMEQLMDEQYHHQLPFDDLEQQFLSYTDGVVALADELAAFNQDDDVKLTIDDQGSICG